MNQISYRFLIGLLLLLMPSSGLAHKNFWEIQVFIFESEQQIDIQAFFNLEHIEAELVTDLLKNDTYRVKDQAQLKELIVKFAQNLIDVNFDSVKAVPFIRSVEFFTEDPEDLKPLDYPISLVDIQVEMSIPLSPAPTNITASWKLFPDALIKKRSSDSTSLPPDAKTVNVYLNQQKMTKFILSSESPQFSWKPHEKSIIPLIPISYQSHIEAQPLKPYILTSILVMTLAFIAWVLIPKLTGFHFLILLIFSGAPLAWRQFSKQEKKTPAIAATNIEIPLKDLIQRLYSSVNSPNRQNKWQLLDHITTEKFQHNFYIDNYKSNNNEREKIVESIDIKSLKKTSANSLLCEWHTNALIQHGSHIHQRKLKFSGIFNFVFEKDKWLLDKTSINRDIVE